ncbi:hypothetical protein PBPMD00_37 [Pinkberry virus LS07-2018-MD00]|jgi:hypothetical protein|nr:hypothetical protein PBPMD00_37 [Pinkberry virus LS07-2018-MD00]
MSCYYDCSCCDCDCQESYYDDSCCCEYECCLPPPEQNCPQCPAKEYPFGPDRPSQSATQPPATKVAVPDVPVKRSPASKNPDVPVKRPPASKDPDIPMIDDSGGLTDELGLPPVFADTIEPSQDLVNADYEEDPIPMIEGGPQLTPMKAVNDMRPRGGSQAPKGSPVPWNGSPLAWQGKSKGELCSMFFPDKDNRGNMVGLNALYDKLRPFKDENNPTIPELEFWNLEVLRHFRRLIGNSTPLNNDRKMYILGRWADERKYTNKWNSLYPKDTCFPQKSGGHCGWMFRPNCIDQAEYIQQYEDQECITASGGHSEGIGGVPHSVPWAYKVAYVVRQFLCQDGTTAHMGPLFGSKRTGVGISFFDKGDGLSVRFKWSKFKS